MPTQTESIVTDPAWAIPIAPSPHELLVTPIAFQAWLAGQQQGAIVGTGGNAEHCPVANWLVESTSCCFASVGQFVVEWRVSMGDYQQERSHEWLQSFVRGIDGLCGSAPVTVAEAMAVLSAIDTSQCDVVLATALGAQP